MHPSSDPSSDPSADAAPAPDKARPDDKAALYAELRTRIGGLVADERDWLANLSNVAAAIYEWLPDLNWAGFYLLKRGELVLGPFQGRPACVRIAVGAGVCGTAVATGESQVVPDVHAFPGHIACDARSRSEIVILLRNDAGEIVGVLDLDSPKTATFDAADRKGLEAVVAAFIPAIDWELAVRS